MPYTRDDIDQLLLDVQVKLDEAEDADDDADDGADEDGADEDGIVNRDTTCAFTCARANEWRLSTSMLVRM